MITDFASLQAEVMRQSQRRDLASVMPSLIQLAEVALFRHLDLYQITATASGISVGGAITMPTDAGAIESVTIDVGGRVRSLDYLPNDSGMGSDGTTVPSWYMVEPGQIRLLPTPATDYPYTLRYAPAFTPLSDANPTNWLLTNAPDVYLYRTCIQVGMATFDDALITRHTQFYDGAMNALRSQDQRARLSRQGGLRIVPRSAV